MIPAAPGHDGPPALWVEDDAEDVATRACQLIEAACPGSGPVVLGVATGATPVRTYERLVASRFARRIAHLVLLDEYVDVPAEDPGRFRSTIERLVADPLGLPSARVHVPPAADPSDEACARFEASLVALGGVDVQLLGIGRNGHVGFNEPGSPLQSRTRRVTLAATTVADNAGSVRVGGRVAVTQGLGTILDARSLVLLATGRHKARALAAAVSGEVTPSVPASVMQLHPRGGDRGRRRGLGAETTTVPLGPTNP
ncbi:MAG: glucosamine-6-phosphate deaminase [Ilumatobacteraceae bacterium]